MPFSQSLRHLHHHQHYLCLLWLLIHLLFDLSSTAFLPKDGTITYRQSKRYYGMFCDVYNFSKFFRAHAHQCPSPYSLNHHHMPTYSLPYQNHPHIFAPFIPFNALIPSRHIFIVRRPKIKKSSRYQRKRRKIFGVKGEKEKNGRKRRKKVEEKIEETVKKRRKKEKVRREKAEKKQNGDEENNTEKERTAEKKQRRERWEKKRKGKEERDNWKEETEEEKIVNWKKEEEKGRRERGKKGDSQKEKKKEKRVSWKEKETEAKDSAIKEEKTNSKKENNEKIASKGWTSQGWSKIGEGVRGVGGKAISYANPVARELAPRALKVAAPGVGAAIGTMAMGPMGGMMGRAIGNKAADYLSGNLQNEPV
ncbi:hypothetical protein niasHS_017499 [Heterodera schachtii]|uniref:Uncharacterized protein n=1 Tax=Heterodera schachtii TaxID=97005 RepID=A0ABD2I5Q8_HETSC